jgi:hypothetical protein
VWYHQSIEALQRRLVAQGIGSLPKSVKTTAWSARLRPGLKSVGDDHRDYAKAVRGVGPSAPFPAPAAIAQGAVVEAGAIPSFEELVERAYGPALGPWGPQIQAARAKAAREEFISPAYSADRGEGRGKEKG